jgi:hypothetical protein
MPPPTAADAAQAPIKPLLWMLAVLAAVILFGALNR